MTRTVRMLVVALLVSAPALGQPPSPGGAYPDFAPLFTFVRDFAAPLRFAFVFLFVGAVLSYCARWLALRGETHGEGYTPDPKVARRLAIGSAIAWFLAAAAALDAVGFKWFPQFILTLLGCAGTVLMAAAIAVAAAGAGLALGVRDRDVALSLLGSYYLTYHPNRPTKEQSIDLGDGRFGQVARVDMLHTTFDLGGGKIEVRPNAWLMRSHFHWGMTPEPSESA